MTSEGCLWKGKDKSLHTKIYLQTEPSIVRCICMNDFGLIAERTKFFSEQKYKDREFDC